MVYAYVCVLFFRLHQPTRYQKYKLSGNTLEAPLPQPFQGHGTLPCHPQVRKLEVASRPPGGHSERTRNGLQGNSWIHTSWCPLYIPSGKHTKKLWKITMLLMGKSTISMAMFNSKLLNYQRVCWLVGFRQIHHAHQFDIVTRTPTDVMLVKHSETNQLRTSFFGAPPDITINQQL